MRIYEVKIGLEDDDDRDGTHTDTLKIAADDIASAVSKAEEKLRDDIVSRKQIIQVTMAGRLDAIA